MERLPASITAAAVAVVGSVGAAGAAENVPAPRPSPVAVAVVAVAEDLPSVRIPCQEIYRIFAQDKRFRPEFHPEMREALEEGVVIDPHLFIARGALGRARTALARLTYEGAVTEAKLATREALLARPDADMSALLADAATVEGVAEHLLGRGDRAHQAFRFALALDPGRTLDPIIYRPDILLRFDKARTQRPAAGRILVRSSPPGATVLVDGRPAGTTPRDGGPLVLGGIPAGDHLVAVTMPGYWPRVEPKLVTPAISAEVDTILARSEKPAYVRDLVTELRAAVRGGSPEAEGRRRAELGRVLEVEAIVLVTGAEGSPPDSDRTASVAVYDGRTAAPLGERVLELGRKTPAALASEIYELMPPPTASPASTPPILLGAPRPTLRGRPLPVWRRWWFVAGVGGLLIGGTVAGAAWMSETRFVGTVRPCDGC